MLHPLYSLYLEQNCNILSVDEVEGVILSYQNKVIKIPYEKWEKMEEYTLSYFQFQLEKLLEEYIKLSSNGKYTLQKAYITNAILCARQGVNYRGNNINLKQSTFDCCEFLKRQIDIVKPIVLAPLGYYPLLALSKIFNFKIEKNLKESIKTTPIIKVEHYVIIPLYHPVAQIKKTDQLKQYSKIWEYIK